MNYYYSFHQIRETCLERVTSKAEPQAVVAVPAALIEHAHTSSDSYTLEFEINSTKIGLSKNTSLSLLKIVLQMAADIK